ncbi:di-heme enzyme, MXAN_0977 family [Leptospira inadai serovar Lyme str. 10]|uniref:Di-heme enzyme, MXAN_0977 family n=2 Tax=Leptospira inadai serovar Lyme TaxID=293084 RepID=V6HGV4_9LEPT|nr:MbnH family di-heme enzyme [Leptospira inadai]EQA34955.1 di-heme enzyme, MXAN_0977 family [Leptospira inadai serovar Lyme str. 10]PNV71948.1 di-heme enzyme [Leptospira inadai serovar Lyme]
MFKLPRVFAGAGILLLAFLFFSCSKMRTFMEEGRFCSDYDYGLVESASAPPHPPDVCVTPETVKLGRFLFYDVNLSKGKNQSCASCHKQNLGFSDGLTRAIGSTGRVHPRNSIAIANAGYFSPYTWSNPTLKRLDNQTLVPFFSENTATTIEELAISGIEHVVAARLQSDPKYVAMFAEAFGENTIDVIHIARAIAAFEVTMISDQSPFDRNAMTSSAIRGKRIFESEIGGCYHCHGGKNFNIDDTLGILSFQNIGLYNVRNKGDYPDQALHGPAAALQTQGLSQTSGKETDRGKFRTPSLRNVAVTAPYMHDGSLKTLREVIEVFNAGGRNITTGPFAGDGRKNPHKDPRIRQLDLTEMQKSDLIEFLKSLTDDCYLTDPRLSDPNLSKPIQPDYCRTISTDRQ